MQVDKHETKSKYRGSFELLVSFIVFSLVEQMRLINDTNLSTGYKCQWD